MRAIFSALAVAAFLSVPAVAGPQEEALAVLDSWGRAFAASDVDAIVKLYAPGALFMGTGSKTVVNDRAAIRKYFEDALLTRRPRGAPIRDQKVMTLADNVVLIAALNDSTGVTDGKPFSTPGRVTFVIANGDQGWQIVHFHRSAMPN